MATVHDFQRELVFSQEASDEPFWDAVYRKAFPNMVSHTLCTGNNEAQHQGIDRIVLLANGRVLKIDEKKRRETRKDILLEYVSVDTTGALGWIEKDLPIDYLAYAFMDRKRVYLWDWCMLRRAWIAYKADWLSRYKIPPAQNNGYKTLSVAVPIERLRKCVLLAAVIQL